MLKAKQMSLKCFLKQFKNFLDSLSIVVILTPGCNIFSGICVQYSLTFTEWNYMKGIFPSELLWLLR